MLYRDLLLTLGGPAPAFLTALSSRQRDRLQAELLAVYALYEQYGADHLLAAMRLACEAGTYSADALAVLIPRLAAAAAPTALVLPDLPSQTEVDRWLGSYETWVQVEVVQEVPA